MMMCLGMFVFSLSTVAYNELQRRTSWRHPTNSRVGSRPATQFIGPGEDSITLPGSLVPELFGGVQALAELREMGETGKAWALVSGTGEVMGAWVIESLDETHKRLIEAGVARMIDFTLTLKRTDDGQIDSLGSNAADEVFVYEPDESGEA